MASYPTISAANKNWIHFSTFTGMINSSVMVSLPPEQVLYPSAWVDQLPQTWPSAHWSSILFQQT
jgi:hypothetical protein